MFNLFDRRPIIVEVEDGHWDAFSMEDQPNSRDLRLYAILEGIGGPQDTVPNGTYLFNMRRRLMTFWLSLTPIS